MSSLRPLQQSFAIGKLCCFEPSLLLQSNILFDDKPHFKQLFAVKGNYSDGFKAAEAKMEDVVLKRVLTLSVAQILVMN